jgi:hypothetical protein
VSTILTGDLTADDLVEMENRRKAVEATSTKDWLTLYGEIVEQGMYKTMSSESGLARGNVMELIREWRATWSRASVELAAIELSILDDVEIEDAPRQHPTTQKWLIKPEGMKIYWPTRGPHPVVFKDRLALSVFLFFSWFISFKDTLGGPVQGRLDGLQQISTDKRMVIGGP